MIDKLLSSARHAAFEAGQVLLNWASSSNLKPTLKLDGSPLTNADKQSHVAISQILEPLGYVVISEESDQFVTSDSDYWLIDPLDGTKEYIQGFSDFTVNIAFIKAGHPILGVVYAPKLDVMYFGAEGVGAWKVSESLEVKKLGHVPKSSSMRMATSRFHNTYRSKIFSDKLGIRSVATIGSALKYCMVASGDLDVCPRFDGSSEWDTAAAHAILIVVGGDIVELSTGGRLGYGKPTRRNPYFIAFRAPYTERDFLNCAKEVTVE